MMGVGTMEMRVINVTPEMAKSFLAFNYKGNRNLKPSWVKDLAGRIQRGEWRLTHQGILFDKNGNLVDGQHRCHAIVEAGVPVDMVVMSGAEEDAYKVLDQARCRPDHHTVRENLVFNPVHQKAEFTPEKHSDNLKSVLG
jgi:hypothetical protein